LDNKKIGNFIRNLRKEIGLTQKELADKLGVTDRAISKWERGRGVPDISLLEDVAKEHGHTVTTNAYHKEDLSMDTELLKALNALKEGEVSDMVETENAIYFLRIDTDTDEKATEENRQSIIAERESALYEDVLKKWQENDGWDVKESLLEEIEFHNVFTIYADEESTEEGTENGTVSETVDGE